MKQSGALAGGSYGAFELKASYQRHLAWGLGAAVILHVAVVAGVVHWGANSQQGVPIPTRPEIGGRIDLGRAPRLIFEVGKRPGGQPKLEDIRAGIPVPMPDEDVSSDIPLDSRMDPETLAMLIDGEGHSGVLGDAGLGALYGGESPGTAIDEYIPGPEEFVAVEEFPVCVRRAIPVYPQMAQLLKREDFVILRVLVDRRGEVRDAIVARSAGGRLGFDAAALEAAYQTRYKPAIQNGRPVAVWIKYKVVFRLTVD